MKKYKAVFFDLDHTLWDFERNSIETISELYDLYQLKNLGIPSNDLFIQKYKEINSNLWNLYDNNKITKDKLRNGRFILTLNEFSITNDKLAEQLANEYLIISPQKTNLFPHAINLLEYLNTKYPMHIITNGFKEVQYTKIKNSGIKKYFDHIHISEEIGFKKPQPEIFHHAVSKSGTVHEACIMIGDNADTDIEGAINSGIDHILFNPNLNKVPSKVNKSISELIELQSIL